MDELSYQKLRSIEQRERQSPNLLNIGSTFYASAFQYIKGLETRLEEERKENPSSRKVVLVADELRNAKRIWESIMERREKKIIQAALSAARGGTALPSSLTHQEKRFYEKIVALLVDNRKTIFEGGEKNTMERGIVIRVLEDIPRFVAKDMKKYSLKKEDVLVLPKDIAEILIKKEVAEKVAMPQ